MSDTATEVVECPDCGEPMRRDYRFIIGGRIPFVCANHHMAVDESETPERPKCGYVVIQGKGS